MGLEETDKDQVSQSRQGAARGMTLLQTPAAQGTASEGIGAAINQSR